MNGIIIIDKPQGMTSHDVVSFLKRKTGVKRIGHSGTLDPMATGVLPVFIGKATRLIEYAGRPGDPEAKLYQCTIRFGLETDTQDIWGCPLAESGIVPGADEIGLVLKSFEGPGIQRPPMYSAVKVGGRKLYEYARKGVPVDEALIRERKIYIKHIEVKRIDTEAGEACFETLCTKGVYIRTLCADAGRLLGCGAVMSGLRRLKSDGFSIENAIPLDDLRGDEAGLPQLLPMDAPLAWMCRASLDEDESRVFALGRPINLSDAVLTDACRCGEDQATHQHVCVYGPAGFLGIGRTSTDELTKNAVLRPEKVLI